MIGNITAGLYGIGVAPSTNSYESIATANGTGSSGTITFSSIPSTYKHLQIRFISKNTAAGTDAYIQLNSSVDSVYRHQITGDGNGGAGNASANSGIAYILLTSGSTGTSMFGAGVVDILDYASTNKTKNIKSLSGYDLNGSGIVGIGSALWTSTSAITDITIKSAGTNFATGTQYALYGIKD
jgi:hypothetical protein